MKKKIPAGIAIIGILFIVWPLFYLVRIAAPANVLNKLHLLPLLPDISVPQFLFQKLLFIICGIGLLRLQKWSRLLALLISLFGIIIWIVAFFSKAPHLSLVNKIAHLAIYLLLSWYFLLPKTKKQFNS
jgi:hypothetical protein